MTRRRYPVGSEAEIRVEAVSDSSSRVVVVDVRLFRRSPSELSSDPSVFHATDAGLRVPARLARPIGEALIAAAAQQP